MNFVEAFLMFYAAFQSTKYREKGETSQIKQCKQQRDFQLLTAGTFYSKLVCHYKRTGSV
jgi:hypothetical protein